MGEQLTDRQFVVFFLPSLEVIFYSWLDYTQTQTTILFYNSFFFRVDD